jgi:uncharacterized Zn finger protein
MMSKSALKEYFPTFKKTLKGEMFFKVGEQSSEETQFRIEKVHAKKKSKNLLSSLIIR